MTTRNIPRSPVSAEPPAMPLRHGDRLSQPEFHRRYEQHPDDTKFELIGGVVYMASPSGLPHGESHTDLTTVFGVYRSQTPGVRATGDTTTILDQHGEPRPDLSMRIAPEYGGQSGVQGKYIRGAPELIAEVSDSTLRLDLTAKKEDYRRTGVIEYLVLDVEGRRLRAFDLPADRDLNVDPDGIFRSRVFPGLWIDPAAVFALDVRRSLDVLQQGLASPEHAAFVRQLDARRRAD